jgi:hypothetical protein
MVRILSESSGMLGGRMNIHRKTVERARLEEANSGKADWRRWGPYLSERQWGTVREDYSQNGDAWSYFTHDQARSRAYLWGEDGIAVFPTTSRLCVFASAGGMQSIRF